MYKERKSNCSKRIAAALSIRNMRQSELCELTKIPKSAISQYISGAFEPKQDRIHLISKALDVSEAWLMGYDVPMEREKNVPSDKVELTEGEREWLDLYRKVPEPSRPMLKLLFETFGNIPESSQQMVLGMLRVVEKENK